MDPTTSPDDLAPLAVDVVHPLTGEMLVVRDAPDDKLARFMDQIRDYESRLREAKSIVNRELLRRLDLDHRWTRDAGPYRMSAPSPAPGEEWSDPKALREDLLSLAAHGDITVDAVDRAVKEETSYKVLAAGVKALRKSGGVVQETVDRYAVPTERRRYVKVSRP